jgi:integrase
LESTTNTINTTNVETQNWSADPTINNKIKLAVAGLKNSIQKMILRFPTERDKELVADFMLAGIRQENIAPNSRRMYLIALNYLSKHYNYSKSFTDMTADDLANYLDSLVPTDNEAERYQSQKWVSKHKTYALTYQKFYKWLKYPKMHPRDRKYLPHNKWPQVLSKVVIQSRKGSKSPIESKDIWDDKDVAVFLRHCTENPRLRFYHALAYETSARPGELLRLRIEDIADNIQPAADEEDGKLCALIDIGRYGKTKESRIVGITEFSIQYFQKLLTSSYHKESTKKKAFVFLSREYSAYSRNLPISGDQLRLDYITFRDKTIPKLLKRPDVSEEDKKHLQFLKDNKKWHPYILRHSSLTKLAGAPNINDYKLRRHAGWSKRSNMTEIYTHDLKGDSVEDVLEFYGVNLRNGRKKRDEKLQQEMVGPHCPFCHTSNVPDTQFCVSCHKPLSMISYDAIMKKTENTVKEIAEMKARQSAIEIALKKMIASEADWIMEEPEDRKKIECV